MAKKPKKSPTMLDDVFHVKGVTNEQERLASQLVKMAVQGSREFFDGLSTEEKTIALEILQEMIQDPEFKSTKLDFLWEIDYKWKPVSITEFLESEEFMGSITKDLYPKWKEDLQVVFAPGSKIFEWLMRGSIGCLVGSTRVPLLDGRVLTMEELAEEYGDYNSEFWLYSVDSYGHVVPGKASFCRKTGNSVPVYKVTFDNGHSETGTANHPFFLRNGEKRKLIDLKPGDSMMPFKRCFEAMEKYDYTPKGYERVFDPGFNSFIQTHRIVGHCAFGLPLFGGIGNNRVIHHLAGKTNNRPDKLKVMDRHEHIWLHRKENKNRWKDPEYRKKQKWTLERRRKLSESKKGIYTDAVRRWNDSIDVVEHCRKISRLGTARLSEPLIRYKIGKSSERAWERNPGRREDHRKRISLLNKKGLSKKGAQACRDKYLKARKKELKQLLSMMKVCRSMYEACCALGKSSSYAAKLLKLYGYPYKAKEVAEAGLLATGSYKNCKVVSVESVGHKAVYNLTVEGYANYALESGVFVGNCGKSTAAAIGFTYNLYRTSCLRDPHKFFNLMPSSKITFGIYATTITQVGDVGFFKIKALVDSCPYFTKKFPRNMKLSSRLDFTKGMIQVVPGSRAFHALGQDILNFYLDELNFMSQDKSAQQLHDTNPMGQAMEIYNAARARLQSRFMRAGTLPGMMFLLSSERGKMDFMPKHMESISQEIRDGKVHVSHYSLWDVKPVGSYSSQTFTVQVGDKIFPSKIVPLNEPPNAGCETIKVPIDFRTAFERDIDQAIRDIAGVPTTGVAPFIRDKTVLLKCVDKDLKHPFTRPSVTLDFRKDFDINEYFRPEELFVIMRSSYRPKYNPSAPRFVHVDLALNGCSAGIAMAHVDGMRSVKRMRADGTWYDDQCPTILMDFMLEISPPYQSEIDISRIRGFIQSLRDMGMPIARISYDGWQSSESRQIMIKLGFDCVTLSVDRTPDPYLALRQALIETRIRYYAYQKFFDEASALERDMETGKVDHPPGKSKDVSDCAAAVCFHCLNDERALAPIDGVPIDGVMGQVSEKGVEVTGGVLNWGSMEKEFNSMSKRT